MPTTNTRIPAAASYDDLVGPKGQALLATLSKEEIAMYIGAADALPPAEKSRLKAVVAAALKAKS